MSISLLSKKYITYLYKISQENLYNNIKINSFNNLKDIKNFQIYLLIKSIFS